MSFDQWYAMPTAERNHRKLLFLADRQQEFETLDERQRQAWIESITAKSDSDTSF